MYLLRRTLYLPTQMTISIEELIADLHEKIFEFLILEDIENSIERRGIEISWSTFVDREMWVK